MYGMSWHPAQCNTNHARTEADLFKLFPEVIIDALEQLDELPLECLMHPEPRCLKERMQCSG